MKLCSALLMIMIFAPDALAAPPVAACSVRKLASDARGNPVEGARAAIEALIANRAHAVMTPDARSERALAEINGLSEAGRRSLASWVSQQSMPEEFREGVLLALHDEQAWTRFLERAGSEGLADFGWLASSEFGRSVDQLPESLRAVINRGIGERIAAASKRSAPPDKPAWAKQGGALPPKRALAAILRKTVPVERYFKDAIARGVSPAEAYVEAIDQLNLQVFSRSGRATAEQTLQLARDMRTRLAGDEKIILYGSRPNGLAGPSSDIDIAYPVDPGRRSSPPVAAKVDELKRENAAIASTPWPTTSDGTRNRMALLSPFMLEVRVDGVDLLVFSPEMKFVPTYDYVATGVERVPLGIPLLPSR